MSVKIVVIGGGMGGYPAAIRAARLGGKVALIEKNKLGGTCLHAGCIPTKTFLQSAEIFHKLKSSLDYGIAAENISFKMDLLARRKDQIRQQLESGVKSLIRSKKIELFNDEAEIISTEKVLLKKSGKILEADRIIIASGAVPSNLPATIANSQDVLNSNDVLLMSELPNEVVIIGGGVVGIEFAQFFSRVGKKVTVIEMLPRILLGVDEEIVKIFTEIMEKENKIKLITEAKITKVFRKGNKKEIIYLKKGEKARIEADEVIVATGRIPQTAGLGLEKIGVDFDTKGIKVNNSMETNIRGIFAVGDVTGGIMLAHVALAEGECAARNAIGIPAKMNYKAVPKCIYTSPEIASVGLTEEEASKEFDIKVGRFPFYANGKAVVMNETAGLVKIIAEKKHGEIIGAHIIGPQATNLISELTLAINLEATVEDLVHTIHPHPTLSEAILEAAMNVNEGAIHLP